MRHRVPASRFGVYGVGCKVQGSGTSIVDCHVGGSLGILWRGKTSVWGGPLVKRKECEASGDGGRETRGFRTRRSHWLRSTGLLYRAQGRRVLVTRRRAGSGGATIGLPPSPGGRYVNCSRKNMSSETNCDRMDPNEWHARALSANERRDSQLW